MNNLFYETTRRGLFPNESVEVRTFLGVLDQFIEFQPEELEKKPIVRHGRA